MKLFARLLSSVYMCIKSFGLNQLRADPSGREVKRRSLGGIAGSNSFWDMDVCLSLVSIVFCQSEVPARG